MRAGQFSHETFVLSTGCWASGSAAPTRFSYAEGGMDYPSGVAEFGTHAQICCAGIGIARRVPTGEGRRRREESSDA